MSQPLTARFIQLAQTPRVPLEPQDPEVLNNTMVRAVARGRAVRDYLAARTWVSSRQLYR